MSFPRGTTLPWQPAGGCRAALLPLFALLLSAAPALAQRKYLVEAGAAGALLSFDKTTDLGTGVGGLVRLGVWLPARFEIEGDGSLVSPKTKSASVRVSVKTFGISLLYNLPIGLYNSAYAKVGVGSTSYGGGCPAVAPNPPVICGSSGAILGGLGFRVAVGQTVMIRTEGVINRNSSAAGKFSNFGANLGVSVMLGSKRIVDSDGDGVLDSDDHCPGTPVGALVDKNGCPTDSDGDGVFDGIDRCPNTPANAKVDATGCPMDTDGDGVPDGLDKCPNTPPGAAVDKSGCAIDSDGDGVADGLDRCPDTPKGATVDALGCPSDTDGDGVLDGLDKCPNTPPGTPVNAFGCPAGQAGEPPRPAAEAAPAGAPPAPQRIVLRDAAFSAGSARLRPEAHLALDSAVAMLEADPNLRLEIGGHTANSRSEIDNRQMASLRIEAVRSYLIGKGIRPQRLVPKNYGTTAPVTADTTAAGRAINRRIEITPIPAGP